MEWGNLKPVAPPNQLMGTILILGTSGTRELRSPKSRFDFGDRVVVRKQTCYRPPRGFTRFRTAPSPGIRRRLVSVERDPFVRPRG
jgi:hypothetical protein